MIRDDMGGHACKQCHSPYPCARITIHPRWMPDLFSIPEIVARELRGDSPMHDNKCISCGTVYEFDAEAK